MTILCKKKNNNSVLGVGVGNKNDMINRDTKGIGIVAESSRLGNYNK